MAEPPDPAAGGLASPARLAAALGGRLPPPGARIGLLGGSFNPAHGAHLEISLAALKRLGLDEVWWLVSPQNPLKPRGGMAALSKRLGAARRLARHPRVRASALESVLGTRYTADTLAALTTRFPQVRFVWLMGADNLLEVEFWQNWPQIFHRVPVAVFDRPTYASRALAATAAQRFARYRLREGAARQLADRQAPAWVFIHSRLNPLSATGIRARRSAARQPGRKRDKTKET